MKYVVLFLALATCAGCPSVPNKWPWNETPTCATPRGTRIVCDTTSTIPARVELMIERMIGARPVAEENPWHELIVYVLPGDPPYLVPKYMTVRDGKIAWIAKQWCNAFRRENTVYVPGNLHDLPYEISHWTCEHETGHVQPLHTQEYYKRPDVIRMIEAGKEER